ncbi:Dodecaprenyl-phosphate galacturonate synthase [Firmicutes bacterium ASF500]|nr:Dodecaprenyl-phosphate galacturonate synthase [Firmicutes bacterium ASF500]
MSLLSIVIPVFNEGESIPLLYSSLKESIGKVRQSGQISGHEIWFVSDGSTDNSEEVIKSILQKDEKVHLIAFRKNFGKAAALQAGFRHCNGDIVITMDADLQDDPAEISRFIQKLNEGYDLVSGWKYNRQDPLEKRLPSKLFNRVTSGLSGIYLHDFNCGFKAYRKEVVKSIDIYGELHRYIPVLAFRKGFRIAEITVEHHKREFGKSKYGLERYLRGLFDSFSTSFLSKFYDRPMYFFGRIGFLLCMIGLLICGYLTVLWIMGNQIGQRPLLILGVLCLILGIQSISTGFIGDMIVDATYRNRYEESHIKEIV